MPEWSAPGWLWAAALAPPLVWWLHARRAAPRSQIVSALYLWRAPPDPRAPRAGPGRRDPRWWLRAAAAISLCLAAAGPRLPLADDLSLHLWLDNSPGMQTMETAGRRAELALQVALEALALELRSSGVDKVLVHVLGNPGESFEMNPAAPERERLLAAFAPGEEAGPMALPPPAASGDGERHWLISDGTRPGLARWLEHSAVSRIIQVGEHSGNLALTRLAARRGAGRGDPDQVLVTVSNSGPGAARRTLELSAAGKVLHRIELELAAKQHWSRSLPLPSRARGPLTARLSPLDRLPGDDRLDLDTTALGPLAVTVMGTCAPALETAIARHRGLVPGLPAGLAVVCAPEAPSLALPTLWFRQGSAAPGPGTQPVWHAEAGSLAGLNLKPGWLAPVAGPPALGTPVLRDAQQVLIALVREPVPRLEVRLDPQASELARRAQFALLVAGLVELLLGTDRLDPVLVADQVPASLAPVSLLAPPSHGASVRARQGPGAFQDLATLPMAVAAALVLFEVLWPGVVVLPGAGRRRTP